jgi:hypothetical protein
MLLNIPIIPKAPQTGYSIGYIFLQGGYILFKPLEKAVHIGFVRGVELDCLTLGLYLLVLSR